MRPSDLTYRRVLAVAVLLVFALAAGCSSGGGGGNAIDAGLPTLELTAPGESGAGEVPVFEWAAVEGAVRYRLVVLDGSGAMLWSWNGSDTKVRLGGLPDAYPEGSAGPVIAPGSSWSVVAFGADGKALAVSSVRSVSP